MMIHLIVGLIKNILLYKVSYFPEEYTRSKNKIKFEFDLSNYATKSDLKNATGVAVRGLEEGGQPYQFWQGFKTRCKSYIRPSKTRNQLSELLQFTLLYLKINDI